MSELLYDDPDFEYKLSLIKNELEKNNIYLIYLKYTDNFDIDIKNKKEVHDIVQNQTGKSNITYILSSIKYLYNATHSMLGAVNFYGNCVDPSHNLIIYNEFYKVFKNQFIYDKNLFNINDGFEINLFPLQSYMCKDNDGNEYYINGDETYTNINTGELYIIGDNNRFQKIKNYNYDTTESILNLV